MTISKTDVAKACIFVSSLMVFFGAGNYVATMMLSVGPGLNHAAAARWVVVWALLALTGIPCLVLSIVYFRKTKHGSRAG